MAKAKETKVTVPNDVLRGHLHGGTLYAKRIDKASKGRSENSGKRSKEKLRTPPPGGWKGGDPANNR